MQRFAAQLIALALLLAGCAPVDSTATPAATPTETGASPTATPAGTSPPASPTASPTVRPSPTEEPTSLPPFDCSALPYEGEGEVELANISDVRVGRHDRYDRVVFEFQAYPGEPLGVPEHMLRRIEPPLEMIPSGLPLEVAGDVFLQLTLLGGTTLTGEFEETYEGRRSFEPDFPQLVALVEAGDFEATADWYLGLASEPCLRVLVLDEPPRLVIDIEHD